MRNVKHTKGAIFLDSEGLSLEFFPHYCWIKRFQVPEWAEKDTSGFNENLKDISYFRINRY